MLRKHLLRSIPLALAALPLLPPCPAQDLDFAHGLVSASSVYPTKQSVMDQLQLETESIVNNSTQPILNCAASGGYAGNDVADGEWGTIALLAFWWHSNDGSAIGFSALTQSGHAAVTQSTFQTFAQTEINDALGATGNNPCDVPDTGQTTGGSTYLLSANGYLYSKYTAGETAVSDADYEETALSLIYKDIIFQYNTVNGVSLFTPAQMASMMTGAQSNWSWLTIDAVYNPEYTANQVMMAILGGYWLGFDIGSDTAQFGATSQTMATAQMSAALNYYDGGLANSNQTTGYRQIEIATNPQGYKFFTEHYNCILPTNPPTRVYNQSACTQGGGTVQLDGFDTHYSGLQLTHMVQMTNIMSQAQTQYANECNTYNGTSCIGPNVYGDALAEAKYSSDRLSQAGTMHGGSRHNEIGANSTDMTFSAGYNYFGSILGVDLGRALVTMDSSNGTGDPSKWGHRSAELIFLYLNYQPWVTASLTVNNLAGLRRGNVSVAFDAGNQPQEIAVGGTVLTDVIHGSVPGSYAGVRTQSEELGTNGKAQGLEIVDVGGDVTTPAVMGQPIDSSTTNYTLRTVSGTASIPGGSADIRQYYVTDGTSLYLISPVQFPSGSTSLDSVGSLLGIPYISATNRIVDVCTISATACGSSSATVALDLSAGTAGSYGGSYRSATGIGTGGVNIYAWPEIVAQNAATVVNAFTWMSPSGDPTAYTNMLDELSSEASPVFYYPNSASDVITESDEIRTQMQPVSGPTTYHPGDLIASVARIAPTLVADTMTVTAHYATGSTYNLASCASSPCLDIEDTGLSFTVSATGTTSFTDKSANEPSPPTGLTAQTIYFSAIPTQLSGTQLTLTATATSGLVVSFASNTPTVCTVSGTMASLLTDGSCTIAASQPGNSTYAPAPGVIQTFAVNVPIVPGFTVSGTTVTISAPGATIGNTSTITVAPGGGFIGNVALTAEISSGPSNAAGDSPEFSFGTAGSVPITSPSAGSTTLTISTKAPSIASLGQLERPALDWRSGSTLLACVLFFSFGAYRRRWRAIFGALLLLISLTGGTLGCGGGGNVTNTGGGNPGTAPGAYQVTITASSGTLTAQTAINFQVQ
jgi:hypothetical protein